MAKKCGTSLMDVPKDILQHFKLVNSWFLFFFDVTNRLEDFCGLRRISELYNLCLLSSNLMVHCQFMPGLQNVWASPKIYTFCATPKDDFYSINLVIALAQKFLKKH